MTTAWTAVDERAIEDAEGAHEHASDPVTQEQLDAAQDRYEQAIGWTRD